MIGINYFKSKGELRGCINDVKNVERFLRNNYQFSDIRILTDDQSQNMPTKDNILAGFRWLVQGAQAGDSLFLHYSGHGSHQSDDNGDEHDGQDETLCPVDYERSGMITDDMVHDMLVRPLVKGVNLTAIFDCCHSGSIMDLPFTYQPDGNNNIQVRNNTKEALAAGMSAFHALRQGQHGTAIQEITKVIGLLNTNDKPQEVNEELKRKMSEADIIMFSGCKDNQTSADAHIEGQSTGAMSWAILKVLSERSDITLTDLLRDLRGNLQGHYQQIPQMSTSHEMDVNNIKFSLD